jgi:hypothetical protein
MKRDMDLVRDLLLAIENHPTLADGTNVLMVDAPDKLGLDGRSIEEIHYHLEMMIKKGLVDGQLNLMEMVSGLTWDGHDFLDTIRDPAIWQATKDGAKKAGGFSLELLGALAKGLIKKKIEEHTGVLL